MTSVTVDDGVVLEVADAGDGVPVLFAHEFGGDIRSFAETCAALSGDYRCIRFSARGFSPSQVPEERKRYCQDRQVRDLLGIADALNLETFHLVGLSMGGFTSLLFALEHQDRLRSLTLAGCSSGPRSPSEKDRYRNDLLVEAGLLRARGGEGAVEWFSGDPAYARVPAKAPDRWRLYLEHLRSQSVSGALHTLETVHWNRISLWNCADHLAALTVSTLLIHGDEDHAFIDPTNAMLERVMPNASRVVLPATGHLVQVEEPVRFLGALHKHFSRVDSNAGHHGLADRH